MTILYGEYKNINAITAGKFETEDHKRVFEVLQNGEFTQTSKRIKDEEFLNLLKIFIRHYLSDTNCYSTYSIVGEQTRAGSGYLQHCKQHDCKIDREHSIIVLEQTEDKRTTGRDHDITPEEIRQQSIVYHTGLIKRCNDGIQEECSEGLTKAYNFMINDSKLKLAALQ